MEHGVAKQVRARWPQVFDAYKAECKAALNNKDLLLGHVCDVAVSDGGKSFIICNLFGQDNYHTGKLFCFTDYIALRKCLAKVKATHSGKSIALPYRMSCSLAGGDWRVVEEIILDELKGCDVTICRYKGNED